jgi:hypothetical protein
MEMRRSSSGNRLTWKTTQPASGVSAHSTIVRIVMAELNDYLLLANASTVKG